MTIGKKIGLAAFIISELLVFFIVILLYVKSVDSIQKTISELFLFQAGIMATTWGTKAIAGFRVNRDENRNTQ